MIPARDALLGVLLSFEPRRGPLDTDWPALADLAVANGLAPLVSYNLEYRLGGAGAPGEVRERLLGVYQGTANDNVYRMVTLKRLATFAESVALMLLDAAAIVEGLYPHIAFRPLPDLAIGIRPEDAEAFEKAAAPAGFRPVGADGTVSSPGSLGPGGEAARAFSDGRLRVLVRTAITPGGVDDLGVWERSLSAKAYGPSARRPSIEDSLLLAAAAVGRAACAAPLIEFVDLRELVCGAPATGVIYPAPPDPVAVADRAVRWGVARAVHCALAVTARLFREAAAGPTWTAGRIPALVRAALGRFVVRPAVARAGTVRDGPAPSAIQSFALGAGKA